MPGIIFPRNNILNIDLSKKSPYQKIWEIVIQKLGADSLPDLIFIWSIRFLIAFSILVVILLCGLCGTALTDPDGSIQYMKTCHDIPNCVMIDKVCFCPDENGYLKLREIKIDRPR